MLFSILNNILLASGNLVVTTKGYKVTGTDKGSYELTVVTSGNRNMLIEKMKASGVSRVLVGGWEIPGPEMVLDTVGNVVPVEHHNMPCYEMLSDKSCPSKVVIRKIGGGCKDFYMVHAKVVDDNCHPQPDCKPEPESECHNNNMNDDLDRVNVYHQHYYRYPRYNYGYPSYKKDYYKRDCYKNDYYYMNRRYYDDSDSSKCYTPDICDESNSTYCPPKYPKLKGNFCKTSSCDLEFKPGTFDCYKFKDCESKNPKLSFYYNRKPYCLDLSQNHNLNEYKCPTFFNDYKYLHKVYNACYKRFGCDIAFYVSQTNNIVVGVKSSWYYVSVTENKVKLVKGNADKCRRFVREGEYRRVLFE
ncbi:hypothetical protein HERIO_1063 [Hepatospora eriocheir]|uniref:Uncharacterized protein n=1 Tax=Hepatospora eriocheir TaxID=1081669 RepID=A0A1X0QBH6_9MICR|nr:hypothetical protein HERIO_1063 [Hepatospora eriocheir]